MQQTESRAQAGASAISDRLGRAEKPAGLSFVCPVFNEVESLEQLYSELDRALQAWEGEAEVVFVDDGSTDGSRETLQAIVENDPRCRLISFRRNVGKSAAYAAGFQAVSGAIVVTLDSDLQDDPAELPKLIEEIEHGADLVVGWKQNRMENEPNKAIPSRFYNALKSQLFGVTLHDSNSGFRAMRRTVAQRLDLYGDRYRFIPELAHLAGFRVREVPVQHRPREHGHSKYNGLRFWTGLLDLIAVRFVSAFSQKPLQAFGTIGLPLVGLGGLLEAYVLLEKLTRDTFQEHIAALVSGVLLILMGVQILGVGLIGELLSARVRPGMPPAVSTRHGFPTDETHRKEPPR